MANGTSFGLWKIAPLALAGVLLFSFVALGCHLRKKRDSKNIPQDQDKVPNNDDLSQEEEGNGLFSFSWISSVQQSDDAGGSLDEVSASAEEEAKGKGDGWYPSWVSSFLDAHNLQ